jgi:hypothetical protein
MGQGRGVVRVTLWFDGNRGVTNISRGEAPSSTTIGHDLPPVQFKAMIPDSVAPEEH